MLGEFFDFFKIPIFSFNQLSHDFSLDVDFEIIYSSSFHLSQTADPDGYQCVTQELILSTCDDSLFGFPSCLLWDDSVSDAEFLSSFDVSRDNICFYVFYYLLTKENIYQNISELDKNKSNSNQKLKTMNSTTIFRLLYN